MWVYHARLGIVSRQSLEPQAVQGVRGIALVSRMRGRYALLALLVVAFFFRAAQNMAQTTLGLLGREALHLGSGMIGAEAALSAGSGLVGVYAASKVPTHQARRGVGVGISLMVVSLAMFAIGGGLVVFSLAAILLGLGGGLAFPSLATALGAAGEGARDRALAAYGMALSASLAVGPLVQSAVIAAAGGSLRVGFATFAAVASLALVVLGCPRLGRAGEPGAHPRPSAGSSAPSSPPGGGSETGMMSLWRNPSWRLATLAQLLYQIPFTAIVVFGAIYAREDFGFGTAEASMVFVSFFILSLIVRAGVGVKSPIRHKRAAFVISGVATLVGLVGLASARGPVELLMAMAVLGLPHALIFPVSLALVAQGVPQSRLAAANAALAGIMTVATVITPALMGPLAGHWGLRAMFVVVMLPVVGLVLPVSSRRAWAEMEGPGPVPEPVSGRHGDAKG